MSTFKSGWSKVERSATGAFTGEQTEITGVVKEETGIDFETPTEELANNKKASAGKACNAKIVTKDVDQAVLTTLRTSESNQTEEYFRFIGLNTAQNYIVKKVLVIVEHVVKPAGAFNKVKITGSGYGVQESDVITLTP